MQAIKVKQSGGLETIFVDNIEQASSPKKGEITVRIHAGSLNYHDYLVAAGHLKTDSDRVLLSDGAGVVEQVGEGVTEFKVGDHVVSTFFPQWLSGEVVPSAGDFHQTPGDGTDGYAMESVTRPVEAFTHAPAGWSHAEAATITTAGLTAWRALVADGKLKAGDTILTLGTGGVSIAALQIGKMFGANVIITSSSDDKLAKAKALGADATINYREHPDWAREVMEITNGLGAKHILELGGPGTLEQSIKAAAVGGHISLIGVMSGLSGQVPTGLLMMKQVRLQGLLVGTRRQQQDYVKALEMNDFRPVIDKSFKYQQLAEAFEYQTNGAHFGKICVEW
ncbi:zinc-dependent alcohol dehydrogenase family protein [Methylophaga sulfidovorans]|uniref:NADPH:quinone reductase n=1 Tax=Methylophaga sulfidovorans TaxID=45496 RepID=A0A1I4B9F6_9GAMM|nr:NAD(P)-dependent alcohol dehydrogenase [Methylophaga sulfidovorans]SFK65133.1 NADPH:quinone reductase [Methylophaga sulfidovorans]